MVDMAIIYCSDGVMFYRPNGDPKFEMMEGIDVMPLNFENMTMEEAKKGIEVLKG